MVSAARKQGRVVMSGPTDPRIREALPARFKERFGIAVEYIAGRSSELAARLRNERRSGLYTHDVALSGGETAATIFYAEKMLDPMRPLLFPEVLDGAKWKGGKPWFYDPEDKYVLRLLRSLGALFTINAEHVKPEEIRSIHDLLSPKWKKKISASDPTIHGGAGSDIPAILFLSLGEEFVKKLYLDHEVAVSRNSRQMEDWLVRGIYPISFGVGSGGFERLKKEGFPVAAITGLRGFPGYVSTVNPLLCIFNKAPHPDAARLFVNWLASKEGLEVYARAAASGTTRSDIDESFIPSYSLPEPGVNYLDADSWDFIVKNKKTAIARMAELMRGRTAPAKP
jgi:iron(III) transport system substrate-binding protein